MAKEALREMTPRELDGERVVRFLHLFKRVLAVAVSEGLTDDAVGRPRDYGCLGFLLGPVQTPIALIRYQIGVLPRGSPAFGYCSEKIRRVAQHGLISSFQLRDRDRQRYGGCVCLSDDRIIGYSGSGEETEEAAVLIPGLFLGEATPERVADVLALSRGDKFYRLFEACEREQIAA